jgi:hypothetical protein
MTFKSDYYSLSELTYSDTAIRLDIKNIPSDTQIENLSWLCAKILDPLTNKIGHRLTFTSGFRCKPLNLAIGGAINSDHMQGRASDIICAGMTVDVLMNYIINGTGLPFDQLIYEFGKWLHISYDITKPRQRGEILMAVKENGVTVYKPYKGAISG